MNFSLEYHYNIKHRRDGNGVKYQLGGYSLIQYQILQIDMIRIEWQIVRRIVNEILGVKGLNHEGFVYLFLFLLLIDSLECCPFLRMAVVISLVLVLQQKNTPFYKEITFCLLKVVEGLFVRHKEQYFMKSFTLVRAFLT